MIQTNSSKVELTNEISVPHDFDMTAIRNKGASKIAIDNRAITHNVVRNLVLWLFGR